MVKKFLLAGTMAVVAALGSLLVAGPAQAAGGSCVQMRPAHQGVRGC